MFYIHRTNNTQELKSHLVNLFRVAGIDGKISRDEFELLFVQSRKLGFSDQDLAKITAHDQEEVLNIPDSLEERVQHLFDLVCMVVADHKIDHREILLCQKIAESYGIGQDKVEQLIGKLVIASSNPALSETFLADVEQLLKA